MSSKMPLKDNDGHLIKAFKREICVSTAKRIGVQKLDYWSRRRLSLFGKIDTFGSV